MKKTEFHEKFESVLNTKPGCESWSDIYIIKQSFLVLYRDGDKIFQIIPRLCTWIKEHKGRDTTVQAAIERHEDRWSLAWDRAKRREAALWFFHYSESLKAGIHTKTEDFFVFDCHREVLSAATQLKQPGFSHAQGAIVPLLAEGNALTCAHTHLKML